MNFPWLRLFRCVCLIACFSASSAILYKPLDHFGHSDSIHKLSAEAFQHRRIFKRQVGSAQHLNAFNPEHIQEAIISGDLSFLQQMDQVLHEYIIPANISSHCVADIFHFVHEVYEYVKRYEAVNDCTNCECLKQNGTLLNQHKWILNVLDSFGKIPSGVLRGNFFLLGDYEQCVQISVPKDSQGNLFNGKYCRADFTHTATVADHSADFNCSSAMFDQADVSLASNANSTQAPKKAVPACRKDSYVFKLGLCVPNSCSSQDVRQILGALMKYIEYKTDYTLPFCKVAVTCHEKLDILKDTPAMLMLVVVFGLLTCMLFGTGYDYFVYQKQLNEAYQMRNPSPARMVYVNSAPALSNGKPYAKADHTADTQAEHDGEDLTDSQLKTAVYNSQATFAKALMAFSVYTNMKKIFDTEQKAGQLLCVHGVRFLSMTWVILGHTYYWAIPMTDNLKAAYDLPKQLLNQIVLNATVCVDAFYVLGGMLLAYLLLKELKKTNGRRLKSPGFWGLYYLHRFVRLTPVYMLILAVDVTLYRYIADGPLWNQNGVEPNYCRRSWWTNLLYVNNFFVLDELCMSWTWYLANDFQFYALAPPILVLLWKWEKIGVAAIGILVTLSGIIRAVIVTVNRWPPTSIFSVDPNQFDIADDFWNQIYVKPYTRCQPYLIGLLLGYIFYKTGARKLSIPRPYIWLGWSLAIAANCGIMFGLYDYSRTGILGSPFSVAVYAACQRAVWSAGLAWMIFACVSGFGGFVDSFLSWKVWMPLSRITYCGYLVHPLIIHGAYSTRFIPMHIDSHNTMAYNFLAHCSLSFVVALAFSLAFEFPILVLENLLINKHPSSAATVVKTVRKRSATLTEHDNPTINNDADVEAPLTTADAEDDDQIEETENESSQDRKLSKDNDNSSRKYSLDNAFRRAKKNRTPNGIRRRPDLFQHLLLRPNSCSETGGDIRQRETNNSLSLDSLKTKKETKPLVTQSEVDIIANRDD